ncbi:MAG: hypothetical protein ACREGR_05170 [Minisyncoccia bacterium]
MSDDKGQPGKAIGNREASRNSDFVLEKAIFSNVFDKDIQRIYIYKKAERLAKAVHLVAPGLAASSALKERAQIVAVALIDAATLPPMRAREALSRALLALSSSLAIARAAGALSPMNADLIAREAQLLLAEVAAYEAPRLTLEETPVFGRIAGKALRAPVSNAKFRATSKGHIKDIHRDQARREAVLSVIRARGRVYIRDISKVVRDVSEKTIQRELAALVKEGVVVRQGERRWTLYSLA